MDLHEALKTAALYETRMRTLYENAAAGARSAEAAALFRALARDEASHQAYIAELERHLEGGTVPELPATTFRAREAADKARLAAGMPASITEPDGGELSALEEASRAEKESAEFYRRLASELPPGPAAAFARLLAIEEGHGAIVDAELDLRRASGYWFDIREFDMED